MSEELAKLVQRCEASSGSEGTTPSTTPAVDAHPSNPHPNQPSPQSSISEDSLTDDTGAVVGGGSSAPRQPSSEEMVILRAQLEAEVSKNRQVTKDLEEAKAKIMELNRRCQDATRAYEQERRVSSHEPHPQ